jgi:hypothetical protein
MSALRLREEWLREVALAMVPHVEKAAGKKMPPFRVSCGFPSKGGVKSAKGWTRGQCWAPEVSGDGHAEIFINPGLGEAALVGAILCHELMHACAGLAAGHGPVFQAAMRKLGHEKPFTSANPTPEYHEWAQPIIDAAGKYPHAELRVGYELSPGEMALLLAGLPKGVDPLAPIGSPKKQVARMVKCKCPKCGYVVRTARKWLEQIGPPHCPDHGAMESGGEPLSPITAMEP